MVYGLKVRAEKRVESRRVAHPAIDNILITKSGYENLTPTPKDPEEIIRIVKAG